MKYTVLLMLAVCACSASAARVSTGVGRTSSLAESASSESVLDLIGSLITGGTNIRVSHVVDQMSKEIDFTKAARMLQQKHVLPHEVSSLLEKSTASASLDEESLAKARKFLNGLVEAAYKELDDKIIEAKEFQAQNRGTWQQVVADMARLGQQIADHIRRAAEATACIAEMGRQIDAVKQQRADAYAAYLKVYNVNYADMTVKQNDLDVFDFLIKTTKTMCDEQAVFLQGGHHSVQMCEGSDGATLRFADSALQSKFDRMLMKGSRDLLKNALMQSRVTQQPMNFVQTEKVVQPMTKATAKVPVVSGQNDEFGELKCGPIPDCGLLYDTLSIEWGGYKDQVDELKKKMTDNAAAWKELKADYDAQIESLTAAQAECIGQLAEAIAKKNADQQELGEKTEEKRVLDHEHEKTMKEFRSRIKYIFNQDICGPIVIRNEVMKTSTECAPKLIDDCDVTPWTPNVCSVECDDACPEGVGCGGTQRLTREAVVRPNACGIKCPAFTVISKCNQFKCPVDCLMSRWSGWSKCSKDCEGGVEQRTRSIITKPKNGGQGCSAVADARPCNTGSCDRDCTLEDWTTWSPCSMACSSGNQERVRKVDIPIRGGGRCPKSSSRHRIEDQDCNTHDCVGDEICIAVQDLIINVDGSGSVNTENWALVKNFTGEMLKRYKTKYYGATTMQVGAILFGNGVIEEDGTISKAVLVSELVTDLAAVKTAVAAMEHQKGFTNMAQGFVLAEKLFQQRSRSDAQSGIMTISDGKPSFLFETTEKSKELDDKGIMKYMVAIAEFPGSDAWRLMRDLATFPSATNTVRVPGFDALQDGGGPFVQQAIAKFCPDAMSPSLTLEVEVARGFMLVYEKGYCGNLGNTLSRDTIDPQACFALAQDVKATGFSMGRRFRKGKCCVETLVFTCDNFNQWQTNPDAPECASSWGGGFHNSRYYDWYALEPSCSE